MRSRSQKEGDEFAAAALGDASWLAFCLRKCGDKVTYDSNGLAPIHLAALHGRLDCLKLLIEKQKVDVNLPSGTGWRPIHMCVSNSIGDRAVQCLNYLLKHGADPSALNDDDVTPTHQAASEGHMQCLQILIEHGGLMNSADKRGHSPMDLAKVWGHRKCARILASERWHQEKAGIASDMAQLRKKKMEQVICDLENEEKRQQNSCDQLAFNEWLDKHGLPPNGRTEPTNAKNRHKKSTAASKKSAKPANQAESPTEPLLKSNSVSRSTNPNASDSNTKVESADGRRKSGKSLISPMAKTVEVKKDEVNIDKPKVNTKAEDFVDKSNAETDNEDKKIAARHWISFENPDRWNSSCKVRETFHDYQPKLGDAYPRDVFTMMPTKDATPHNLNIRHPKIFVTDEKERVTRADELVNAKARLSRVNFDVEALPGDEETLRPVFYRCKAVQDLPKRKPVHDLPTKLVCEGGMHLTDDVRSPLFRAGLVVEPSTTANSSRTSLGSEFSSFE